MIAPTRSDDRAHRSALITILQMAYSGEKAAAFAYQGHWRSVRDAGQKLAIQKIETEEWEHRAALETMLSELGSRPVLWREVQMAVIGRTVAIGCFLIGWFFPMYLAGQLETSNVDEYDVAAAHADFLGLSELGTCLRAMAKTERDHETFFASMVVGHPWLLFANAIFGWHPERRIKRGDSVSFPPHQSRFSATSVVAKRHQLPKSFFCSDRLSRFDQ